MKLRHFAQDCKNAFGAFSTMRLAHFRSCVWRILGWSRQQFPKSVKSVKSQAKSRENPQKSRESRENGPRGKVWGTTWPIFNIKNHKKPYIK